MKSLFKVSLLAATVMLAVGCQKEDAAETSKTDTPAAQTETKQMTFKSEDEKAAYAIGVSFANYLNTSLDKPKEMGIELDKKMVLAGIEDAFADKSGLSEEEAHKALEGFDKRLNDVAAKKAKEKADADKKAGDDFRAKFEKEDGVKKTESGLLYKELTPGTGKSPKATDTVEVQYKGTLIDGTKFDSSYDRGKPATFPLNRVIPGWTEGVQLMKEGAKYEFVIPPELAYGDQATPTIPANSTLVFEVELIKVHDAKEEKKAPADAKKADK
ncbi:FKBP-type peptidyl-prolyl cis-trans isomerase [Vibrio sp.]|uniref:Peptidyl-prolyl cis-trans isomerase n=1 Tax=Vibrio viridaestus TaxID=2487322 RepID=A0A3N9TB37_9VIBR|nr:FKBP-type peptidyl-prolyl cis-trans isomerase [Vibrio viridaestus]MDC0612301.1 FKBP-type peptidyl-prolyl cis-trans isomerase [Vibrio sp.]RQW61150.1 FKBP-type peptidyl-prolyl cis-trans isomerase [Vibrio viridaestus]